MKSLSLLAGRTVRTREVMCWLCQNSPAEFAVHLCVNVISGGRSGSVVECLIREREAAGSSLAGVTALCP